MTVIIFDNPGELSPKQKGKDKLLKDFKKDQINKKLDYLINRKGVYLIDVDGKKYVGSAYGMKGIYGRWNQYINYFNPDSESKRDSNNSQRRIGEKLRDFHQGKNFQKISFKVLEYFEESTSDEEIIDFETKSKKDYKSYHVQTGNKDASANGLNMN